MAYCTLTDLKEQIQEEDLIFLTYDRTEPASGNLNAVLSESASVISLVDGCGFPACGRVKIDSEQIDYTGRSSNQLIGCQRGVNNTTSLVHAVWAEVTELSSIDTSVVERAIADADAEINSYCAAQYDDLPFSRTPLIIRKLSVDMAIYNLYSRRKAVPEQRRARYQACIGFLENVARGIVSLGADSPAADKEAGPEATTRKSDRIFSMGTAFSAGTLDNY